MLPGYAGIWYNIGTNKENRMQQKQVSQKFFRPLFYVGCFCVLFFIFSAARAEAAIQIYYSVGQNVNDHKTGTPTITISGGVATFSVAQTAANMGVGDKISYGYANATTTVYISAKQSATAWNVITKTGGQPTATATAAVLKISHAFNSLENAVTGASDSSHLNTADLIAGNYVLNIPCYYDSGPDTSSVLVANTWTTGALNYIKIYAPFNTATEANQAQRHSGKWDNNKYQLIVSNLGSGGNALYVNTNYLRVDGLQVQIDRMNGDAIGAISFGLISGPAEAWVSNSILKQTNWVSGSYHEGIAVFNGDSSLVTLKAWNNIIYGFNSPDDSAGILFQGYNAYLYNNTIFNSNHGYYRYSSGNVIAKNNIAYNNADNYTGSFSATSTNNLSGPNQSDAPGANARQNAIVSFYSTSTSNFHLLASDINAKDHGTDLSADPYLPFNADIDGQTRTGAWDIGADEFVPLNISIVATSSVTVNSATVTWTTDNLSSSTVQYGLSTSYGSASSSSTFVTSHIINLSNLTSGSTYHFRVISTDAFGMTATSSDYTFKTAGATQIYYSVGQNTNDHKTDAPTLTISGGVGTFSVAQTASNMGVGDKVTYNTDQVAYISGKISTSLWTLETATGGTPDDVTGATVNSITHAFASLAAAIDDYSQGAADVNHLNTTDLVAGNYFLNIPCYYDSGPDTNQVYVTNWTTGVNNYIKVYTPNNTVTEVNISQRHSGVWNANKYNINITTSYEAHGLEEGVAYFKVDGLQVKMTSTRNGPNDDIYGIGNYQNSETGAFWASDNIVWGVVGSS